VAQGKHNLLAQPGGEVKKARRSTDLRSGEKKGGGTGRLQQEATSGGGENRKRPQDSHIGWSRTKKKRKKKKRAPPWTRCCRGKEKKKEKRETEPNLAAGEKGQAGFTERGLPRTDKKEKGNGRGSGVTASKKKT